MSASLPRKALISISSYYGVIYPDGTRTGLFFTEALHPFEVLTQAGFEVDLATETGTYGLDDLSLTDRFLAGDDKAVFEDPKHPFNVKLKKAADLKAEEYGLFFGSAAHAALYDYPTARGASSSRRKCLATRGNRRGCRPRTSAAARSNRLQHRQVDYRWKNGNRVYGRGRDRAESPGQADIRWGRPRRGRSQQSGSRLQLSHAAF
jgi:hypothetical protein